MIPHFFIPQFINDFVYIFIFAKLKQTKLKDTELELEGLLNLLYLSVDNKSVHTGGLDIPSNIQQSLLTKIEYTNHSVQVLYNVSSRWCIRLVENCVSNTLVFYSLPILTFNHEFNKYRISTRS